MEVNAKVACLVLLSMVMVAPHAEAKLACVEVLRQMTPCLSFLIAGFGPSDRCCRGVKRIVDATKGSSKERKRTCECLKSVRRSAFLVKDENEAALPGKCGVTFFFKINSSLDCNRLGKKIQD